MKDPMSRKQWLTKEMLAPWLVLLIGLILTSQAFYFSYKKGQAESAVRFERQAKQAVSSIQYRLQSYVSALISARGLLLVSAPLQQGEFSLFAQSLGLEESFPGLVGLGYITYLPQEQIEVHEQQMAERGFRNYKVRMDPGKSVFGSYIAPVIDFESLRGWSHLQNRGFDMLSDSRQVAALKASQSTGRPAVGELMNLRSPTDANDHFGFTVYIPVYDPNLPVNTPEERIQALSGWVFSPYSAQSLFDLVFKEIMRQTPHLDLKVYASSTGNNRHLLYQSPGAYSTGRHSRSYVVNFADKEWLVEASSTDDFMSASSRTLPWMTLILGSLLSLVLFFFASYAIRQGIKLMGREKQLRLITDSLPGLVCYIDRNHVYRFANQTYCDWFGVTPGKLVGQKVIDFLGPDAYRQAEPYMETVLRGETVSFELNLTTASGETRIVNAVYVPDQPKSGEVLGWVALITDITQKKQADQRLLDKKQALEITSRIGLRLQAERNLENLLQMITDAARELIKAEFGAFIYNTAESGSPSEFEIVTASGAPKEVLRRFPHTQSQSLLAPTFRGDSIVRLADVTVMDSFLGKPLEPFPGEFPKLRSYLAVPVISRTGEVVGGLFFGHSLPDQFSDLDEKMIAGLASQSAVAIDNARLYQAVRKSERKHRQLARKSGFLAEASQVLSLSLDYTNVLGELVKFVVPEMADWCTIHLADESEALELVALSHPARWQSSPELNTDLHQALLSIGKDSGIQRAFTTGHSERILSLPTSVDENIRNLSMRYHLQSMLSIPILARGRVLGVITFMRSPDRHSFTPNDQELLEELALRVATTVDNSILFKNIQRTNRIKDEFLATVSHELRTPLNVILGYSDLLTDLPLDNQELHDSIDAIRRNAKAQAQIVDDLLDISSIVTGKVKVEPVAIEIQDAIFNAVDNLKLAAQAKGVLLQTQGVDSHLRILGDPSRIQQVLWNLLSNAIKFTPRGGEVSVSASQSMGSCHIYFSDNGAGIEPDFLPHVFDRFRQEDSSMTRSYGGLGLGLAIAKHLVEMHGGTIQAHSAGKGKGAQFTLTFPLLESAQGFTRLLPEPGDDDKGPRMSGDHLTGSKVLVVDDEPDALLLIQKILRRHGASVEVASSSEQAFERLKDFKPDVLLSDIGMPERDGLSLIREIRKTEKDTGDFLPAAALTAYAGEEDRVQVLEEGFQLHFAKPIEPTVLIEGVEKLLSHHSGK